MRESHGSPCLESHAIALLSCLDMLHVRMISGEVVTSMAVEELHAVRDLKDQLHQRHSMPPRFRQRLLFNGKSMDDTTMLDKPMDLDLVLLTFADVTQSQVDELTAATNEGFIDEVGSFGTA